MEGESWEVRKIFLTKFSNTYHFDGVSTVGYYCSFAALVGRIDDLVKKQINEQQSFLPKDAQLYEAIINLKKCYDWLIARKGFFDKVFYYVVNTFSGTDRKIKCKRYRQPFLDKIPDRAMVFN